MDDKQIEQIIRDYLPQIIHMSVATVEGGKPWVFEVHYGFDDDLNLYWMSSQKVRHSQEVAKNANVSGNIVVQHFLGQLARGVAFEGQVEVIEGIDEDHPAYKAYANRFADRADKVLSAYANPEGARIYKVHVSDYYLIDGLRTGSPEKHHLKWPQL